MVKKIFTILLVFSFLNLTLLAVAPNLVKPNIAFAGDEDQADQDAQSARVAVAAVGFVALMGGIYLIYRMMKGSDSDQTSNIGGEKNKEKYFVKKQKSLDQWLMERNNLAKKQKDREKRFDVGLDFNKCGVRRIVTDEFSSQTEDEFHSPELSISYRW